MPASYGSTDSTTCLLPPPTTSKKDSKMECACGKPGSCCQNTSSSSAVLLPNLKKNKSTSQSVWTIDERAPSPNPPVLPTSRTEQLQEILGDTEPLAHKCGVGNGGTCCKELKGDDERHLISPEIVRDVIIGLSDGLTVPFALTAGLSSLGSSRLVVTAGLAELMAGAISMGLGGYLASQAELDHFHYLRKQTRARVQRSCAGEMEREVHAILGPLGVKEALSRLVADDLRPIDNRMWHRMSDGATLPVSSGDEGIETAVTRRRDSNGGNKKWSWWPFGKKINSEDEFEGDEDQGLTAFLLKFGEGIEEVPRSRLYISALTIGLSYFVGGLIPLIPYMANVTALRALLISCVVTVVVLLIFGGFKTYFTGATGGVGGYIYGSVSTAVVGALAAAAAFGLVKALAVND